MKNWNDRASGRVAYVETTEVGEEITEGDDLAGGLGASV
jgi:hypothetical protein